jgi:hypothetical protein
MPLPTSAYRAIRYADWTHAPLAYLPSYAPTYPQSAPLPEVDHSRAVARASVRRPHAPQYTVVDHHQLGAAYYAPERRMLTPHLAEWQAQVLSAVRMMRRWSYYAEALPAPALPNEPLDGCDCRVCLARGSAA